MMSLPIYTQLDTSTSEGVPLIIVQLSSYRVDIASVITKTPGQPRSAEFLPQIEIAPPLLNINVLGPLKRLWGNL